MVMVNSDVVPFALSAKVFDLIRRVKASRLLPWSLGTGKGGASLKSPVTRDETAAGAVTRVGFGD